MRLTEKGIEAVKILEIKKAVCKELGITPMTFWRTYKKNKKNNNFTKINVLNIISKNANIPIDKLITEEN